LEKIQEAQFERNAEKMLRGQRELPAKRDFRCFTGRERTDLTEDFRIRFDNTFPGAPGSKEWIAKKFKGNRKGLKVGFHKGGFLG